GRLPRKAVRLRRARGSREGAAAPVHAHRRERRDAGGRPVCGSHLAPRGTRQQRIELTQKEYALLEYLMRNMGRVVSRQMISENVWHQPLDPLTNVVDVYINYLRRKIDREQGRPLIHTVRGSGYVLKAEG